MSTKEKLCEAALELFSQKGFAATSVDEIAESIGIKGPNLYKYFKGKDALFDEIATRNELEYDKAMSLSAEASLDVHTPEQLKAFSMNQIRYTMPNPRVRKMRKLCSIEQFRNETLRTKLTEHEISTPRDQFTKIFDTMVKEGTMEACDTKQLAFAYIAPISLLIMKCDRDPDKFEECLKEAEEYIDFFIADHFNK